MKEAIDVYFSAEKSGAMLLVGMGAATVIFPIMLLMYQLKNKFFLGMLVPLVSLGMVMLITGRLVYEGADAKRTEMWEFYQTDAAGFESEEGARMEAVTDRLQTLKVAEILLILAGAALFFLGRKKAVLAGLGLGLMIQASAALAFDLVATHRAYIYTEAIHGQGVN